MDLHVAIPNIVILPPTVLSCDTRCACFRTPHHATRRYVRLVCCVVLFSMSSYAVCVCAQVCVCVHVCVRAHTRTHCSWVELTYIPVILHSSDTIATHVCISLQITPNAMLRICIVITCILLCDCNNCILALSSCEKEKKQSAVLVMRLPFWNHTVSCQSEQRSNCTSHDLNIQEASTVRFLSRVATTSELVGQ